MLKKQTLYFLIVGAIASAVNMIVVFILVETASIQPLLANIFGFFIAFIFSYFGHRKFTFSTTTQSHTLTAPMFFCNAIFGLVLNEIIYFVFLHILHIQYLVSLFITMFIVALYTFVVSKIFIFKA